MWVIKSCHLACLAILLAVAGCQSSGEPGDAGIDGLTDGSADGGDSQGGDGAGCPGCWRSALYPQDWSPALSDAQGRYLPDFSWAGYHNGTREPPAEPGGVVLSVLDQGADSSGQADSTAAFQAALDSIGLQGGGVVLVPAGLYRCDGSLTVHDSGVVMRGEGAELTKVFFTSEGNMTGRANLSFAGQPVAGPDLLLTEDAVAREHEIRVADVTDLAPDDDVELGAIISDDFLEEHGMTGVWQASAGQWRAFFRRTVTEVSGAAPPYTVRLDVPTRYPLKVRDGASLRKISGLLAEVGVEDLALGNAVSMAGALACDRAHVLEMIQVKDAWVRRVASFAPPAAEGDYHLQSGGILIQQSKRVTVEDTVLEKAQNRGSGGNGYLFELMQASEVLLRDCQGLAGRHNFIQNWDFGTSGCVFLRPVSRDGRMVTGLSSGTGLSEYHHSLAMANLVDGADSNDGWGAVNRGHESSGAGHTATQNVFWNLRGGLVRSYQYGWGYVIGTRDAYVYTDPVDDFVGQLAGHAIGSEPLDWLEGRDEADGLQPVSLYEDQLARRLGGR
jgi:hypothetical protein